MTISINSTSVNTGNISVGGQERLSFQADGTATLKTSATRTSDPKSIATLETVREMLPMPKFTPFPYVGKPGFEPEGSISSSGQQVLDLQFPSMREDVVGTQYYCTEAEWQADPLKRLNCWSTGDLVSWMRPPDRNGTQAGSIGGAYFGGASSASGKWGTGVLDAMRNLEGVTGAIYAYAGTSGVFYKKSGIAGYESSSAARDGVVAMDASRGLPPGTTTDPITGEFRPKTFYGQWRIQMYGRITKVGDMDASALHNAIEQVQADLTALDSELGFTIIYPNGGTAAAPANVSLNSRYVLPNPFPGHEVMCLAELFYGGKWGATGYAYSNGGFFTQAFQLGDSVAIQTGSEALTTASIHSGNPFNILHAITTPTPCRVKIWKLKGKTS